MYAIRSYYEVFEMGLGRENALLVRIRLEAYLQPEYVQRVLRHSGPTLFQGPLDLLQQAVDTRHDRILVRPRLREFV